MYPSVKSLEAAFPGHGKQLRKILTEEIDPTTYKHVAELLGNSSHRVSDLQMIMEACNEELDGHGVEAIFAQGDQWPGMEYVNMGDAYNTTIIYDHRVSRFKVMCYGEWLEKADPDSKFYA